MEEKVFFENDIDFNCQEMIDENPMLYAYSAESRAQSIEDFSCQYKKETRTISWIVRNDELSANQKYKVVKKYFKKINRDYKKELKKINEQLFTVDISIGKKIKPTRRSFYLIVLQLLLDGFVIFFGEKISVLTKLVDNIFFKILFVIFNILLLITIVLKLILRIDNCERQKNNLKRQYIDKINKHRKTIKKEFKKVKRYYLRNLRKNDKTFEPIGYYKTWGLTRVVNLVQELEENSKKKIEIINLKRKKMNVISTFTLCINIILEIIFLVLVIKAIIK